MRIIAGIAKGKKILPPEGMGTRPTLDRVKENIFNMIQFRVYGTKAIDVFAGTGSLGLEAVSRGAKECYLVDMGEKSFSLLKQNVKSLNFEDKCTCLNMDSYEALKMLASKGMIFDLIFIDPPYLREMIPPAMQIVDDNNLLNRDGLIVSKIDSSEEIYQGTDNIKLTDYRKYGNTTVCFYEYREE